MASRYLASVAQDRIFAQHTHVQWTAKTGLAITALISLMCSATYWWGIQSVLTDNLAVAAAFTSILVLGPPSLVSFLIPTSSAGMLLQKINAETWGHVAVIVAAFFLVYYAYDMQYAWWMAQPVVAQTMIYYPFVGYRSLASLQTIIGIIGTIIIPALLWTPVSNDELVDQVRQAHLVKRYSIQVKAEQVILRKTLIRAQELSLIHWDNLTVEEREELATLMRSLVHGIGETMTEIAESVRRVSGARVPYIPFDQDTRIRTYLDHISDVITTAPAIETAKPSSENQSSVMIAKDNRPPNPMPQANRAIPDSGGQRDQSFHRERDRERK